jgi:hypothetical protein
MKKRVLFLFLLLLFIVFKASSQDFKITLLKLELNGNQLNITYIIDNKNSTDNFRIKIEINKQNGESITPKSISGALGDSIKSGTNRIIVWDLEKDSTYLDEKISVELIGEKLSVELIDEKLKKSYSKSSLILMSTALPGLGQTKMTGKPWWIGGLAAYGTLAGGLVFYKMSRDDYDLYLDAKTTTARDEYFDKSTKESVISNVFFATAASIWVANIIWVAAMPDRNQTLKHAKVYITPSTIPYKGAMVSLRVDF